MGSYLFRCVETGNDVYTTSVSPTKRVAAWMATVRCKDEYEGSTEMSDPVKESETEFSERCDQIVFSGFTSLALAVGCKLRLFERMSTSSDSAMSAQELADSVSCKERYVREWLSALVCANIVEVDRATGRFWLPETRKNILTSHGPFGCITALTVNMVMVATGFDPVCQCFPLDGPAVCNFTEVLSEISDKLHETSLKDKFIPSIPGLMTALDKGIEVLDVGCGTGTPSFMLAQSYPRSTFYGIDFLNTAIDGAEKRASKYKLPNLHYKTCSADHLPAEWKERFSYVTTFDSVHDQARPDLSLKEIYRVLKPGGWYSMVEIKADSDLFRNKDSPRSAMMYTISLFHCMPVSLYFKDGLGLGTMWGKQRALEMLRESGFRHIQVLELPYNQKCLHYLCFK